MIFDSLQNISIYRAVSRNMAAAVDFLLQPANLDLPAGRHAIDGDRVFALVQQYTTKPLADGFWEAHQRYIDVQFVLSGEEAMQFAPIALMSQKEPYNAEKDFSVFTGAGQQLIVCDRQFAIFFPHDVHMPQLAVTAPSPVHKIVLKVAVD